MNAYEYRQEARRERMERHADRLRTEGEARLATADQMAYQMNGQPILVGHHSEKRHRRQIDKMWNHSRQGFAKLKEAQEVARRAGAVIERRPGRDREAAGQGSRAPGAPRQDQGR